MKNSIVTVTHILLAGFFCGCVSSSSQQKANSASENTTTPDTGTVKENASPGPDDDMVVEPQLYDEVLDGWLKLGIDQGVIAEKLGEPERKGEDLYQGATGMYAQQWEYPSKGIVLEMESDEAGGNKNVMRIRIASPCGMKTSKDVGIGASQKAVSGAYADFIDPEFSTDAQLIAGSIYGGVIFTLEAGKVVTIAIGAAAE